MKAVMFRGVGKPLTLERIDEPAPGTGEMVIKVGRCGICGSDVCLTQEHGFFPENIVLGHEFAGEVVALGSGVEGFKVGDRVTAMPATGCGQCLSCLTVGPWLCERGVIPGGGGFAEYARVAASSSIRLPASLSLGDGALVEPLAVALHGVRLAGIGPGSRVLVLGAGSIGQACTYWARRFGAGRIVVASRSSRRMEMAMSMGADAFVETGEGEQQRIAEALGGPPDVVLECIGAVGALGHSIQLVRPLGTVVSLGFCTRPDPVLPAMATFKQVRLVFSMAYSLSEFQLVADTLDRGHLEPRRMVSGPIALEQVPDTIERLRSASSDGKIHVDPWLGA